MKRVFLFVFMLGIGAATTTLHAKSCNVDKHAKLPNISNVTYHSARKQLLSAGWQPIQVKPNTIRQADADIKVGNGKEFWGRGYVEIESCSATGAANCTFLFSDVYRNRLRVTTAGEEDAKSKSFATVASWQFVCD